MENPKHPGLEIIMRLSRWSRCIDEIAPCPIEDLHCTASCLVEFFLDLRKSYTPTLPGFADAERLIGWMTLDEKERVARYLISLHRGKFAAVVRGADRQARNFYSAKIRAIGPEIEFVLHAKFVGKALETFKQKI